MKVEIWSDVMCPFCYMGKRRFENALQQFAKRGEVEIVWKSYLLNPAMKTEPGKNINGYLAEHKGWSLDYAQKVNHQVTMQAAGLGLEYNFDKSVIANSFDAHRVAQFAKTQGLGDAMEERLFKAYFTEGKNIADHATLTGLASDIGLDANTVTEVLNTKAYTDDVNRDVYEAQQVGVRGVPFFVFDGKYAVSGAQDSSVFLQVLEKSFAEQIVTVQKDGEVCTPDGECN